MHLKRYASQTAGESDREPRGRGRVVKGKLKMEKSISKLLIISIYGNNFSSTVSGSRSGRSAEVEKMRTAPG